MELMQELPIKKQSVYKKLRSKAAQSSMVLTLDLIQEFLTHLREKNASANTLEQYRQSLAMLYEALPVNKQIDRETLSMWSNQLLQRGYAARTINVCVSSANSLLAYLGFREFQLQQQLEPDNEPQPELTRGEYLTLLRTARSEQKERVYLLIKLFACTGISVQDIEKVTVEAVQGNCIALTEDQEKTLKLPEFLRMELQSYADHLEIKQGPIFVTRDGKPLGRTNIAASIRQLCQDAGIPLEKGNPRCLRRLYQATRLEIEQDINRLIEQAHERILEVEQQVVGWGSQDTAKVAGKERAG